MASSAPERPVRVVHWGTGATGSFALRAVLARPDLELVGLVVTDPTKVGRDAGELVGVDPVGVPATDDPAQVLDDVEPDCLLYAGTGADRELEAAEDMAAFLRRGVDVSTISLISMVYPDAGPPDVRAVLDDACREGGASFYDSGSSPGVMSADLVLAALACAGRVDTLRVQELVDNSRYPVPEAMRVSAGMGQPMDYVPARVRSGQIERWWGPLVHLFADHLGLALDPLVLEWETAPAPRDLETAYGGVPAGTIGGPTWRPSGSSPLRAPRAVCAVASSGTRRCRWTRPLGVWPARWARRRWPR